MAENAYKFKLNNSLVKGRNRGDFSSLPILEPDYGNEEPDKPRYFQDPKKAVQVLFRTYKL